MWSRTDCRGSEPACGKTGHPCRRSVKMETQTPEVFHQSTLLCAFCFHGKPEIKTTRIQRHKRRRTVTAFGCHLRNKFMGDSSPPLQKEVRHPRMPSREGCYLTPDTYSTKDWPKSTSLRCISVRAALGKWEGGVDLGSRISGDRYTLRFPRLWQDTHGWQGRGKVAVVACVTHLPRLFALFTQPSRQKNSTELWGNQWSSLLHTISQVGLSVRTISLVMAITFVGPRSLPGGTQDQPFHHVAQEFSALSRTQTNDSWIFVQSLFQWS